ncbi:MAG: hypothetical protein ACFFDT_13735 [Candidatus Hodarchaeota archaeon]
MKIDKLLICLIFLSFVIILIMGKSSPIIASDKENFEINQVQLTENVTLRMDLVFCGYNETEIDLTFLSSNLPSNRLFLFWVGDVPIETEIEFDWHIHFASQGYTDALNSLVDDNSWSATTSDLNTTALNLQEATGERMSIFSPQDGTAINGTAVEEYLVENSAFETNLPSYTFYFLNFSHFDSTDHTQEHWFEIDGIDPDSNITASWWRLEWDNDLNPNVEYPYPAWGFQNRLYFIDPYCHQWYTKWTEIWWNSDDQEGSIDYRTRDLDTFLAGYTPGTNSYKQQLALYLTDWLNDIVWDTAGRMDGSWNNERAISAQVLMLNDFINHSYSQKDLEWIIHEKILLDSLEYVIPPELASISIDTIWANLTDHPELETIVVENTLNASDLSHYPWYQNKWTYLDGNAIFSGFRDLREVYFDLNQADTTFTAWFLLMKNISMVYYYYGEWREFTALGGSGNVVFFKDLNRYFASDGTTPRSGATNILTHEIGHVLGFAHAESGSDALEGAGGFMCDAMSYYAVQGTPKFSIFTRDSFYRRSCITVRQVTSTVIDYWRVRSDRNETTFIAIDNILALGSSAFESKNYFEAFLNYRQLYDLVNYLEEQETTGTEGTTDIGGTSTIPTSSSSKTYIDVPSWNILFLLLSILLLKRFKRR